MSGPLAARLRARILADGPISFRDWFETCLYDDADGYYMQGGRTGASDARDFVTSPTLHRFFGEAIAAHVADVWHDNDCPTEFGVVEFGGGEGDLCKDAMDWFDQNEPDLARAITWTHVEKSPEHREVQSEGVDERVQWADAMPEIPVGCVVSNEFPDALPFHWLQRTTDGWDEVHVGVDGEDFVERLLPADPAIAAVAPQQDVPVGSRTVAMPLVKHWIETCAARLGRGGMITVDYGDLGHRMWPSRTGTVRAYLQHEELDEVLARPGEQDLTASIDFSLLMEWGLAAGFSYESFETQESWLVHQGILDAINAVDRDTTEGASSYLRLRQLMLPTGLGETFKVLCLRKP